jgi:DNA-binding IclR family transcriptional regulator
VVTFLQVFDAPSVVTTCGKRSPSTVPLQSLALLNSEFARARGKGFARRLAREAGGRLPGLTPATIRSASRLAAELARVSRQGYSTAVNELEEGYVALGAPVRRHDGRVVAAISLGGPGTRFTPARIPRLIRPLREAADRISRRLGWHDAGLLSRSSS